MQCKTLRSAVNLRVGQVAFIHTKNRQDSSGIGNVKVQTIPKIQRYEKAAEILNRVKERNGLECIPPHIERLLGIPSNTGDSSGHKEKALDLSDKTQFILDSEHPVRYFLERDLYNHSKRMIRYHQWVTLFGRGIRVSKKSNYEAMVHQTALACDVGMFSSDVHQCVSDVPEKVNSTEFDHFRLGNKYATLVGDYFAINCISHAERTKNSRVLMAITNGVAEFATASFSSPLLDDSIMYPALPRPTATVEDWIRYNKKASGYFNGGLYATVLLNYESLPKNEEFMKQFKTFSSNISVFLKGIAEIDAFKNAHDFSTVFPFVLVSLPAVLYQMQNPGAYDSIRRTHFQLNTEEVKKLSEEIERSSAISEAQFILSGMAVEAQESFEKIASVPYYANIVNELIDAVSACELE